MRRFAFVLGIIYVLSPQASSEPDHLLPATRSYDRAYFDLLNRKLATTPFNCGRILVRPPFTGEYSISIYGKATQNRFFQHHITMRIAEENLWQASLGGIDPTKAEGVKINQADIFITPEVAELLRNVLMAIINETRPLGTEKPRKIVIEGPITELMITGLDGKLEIGQMGTFPPTAPKLSLLAKLIVNLRRLCQAPTSERAHLIAEVTRNADALRQQIGQ